MRKRLLCALMAVCMIGTSVTAYAAELERQPAEAESGESEQIEVTEDQEDISDAAVVPEVIPEAEQESDQIPEESEVPVTDVVPDTEPAVTPEQTPDIEPISDEEPAETPSPDADNVPDVSPSASAAPAVVSEEDELVGAIDLSNPITGEVILEGEQQINSGVTVTEAGVLTLADGSKLAIQNTDGLQCYGEIRIEDGTKAAIEIGKTGGWNFLIYEGASIYVGEGATLTMEGNLWLKNGGTIILEKGAALEVTKGNYDPWFEGVVIVDSGFQITYSGSVCYPDNLCIKEGVEVTLEMENYFSGTITAKKNSKVSLTTKGGFGGRFEAEEGASMLVTSNEDYYTFYDEIYIPKGVTVDLKNGTLSFMQESKSSDSWILTGGGKLIVEGDYKVEKDKF